MKGEANPLISICIPVFNGRSFLEDAVHSAIHQTHRPIEIIVQDNASTDGTRELLERLGGQIPEISVVRNPMNVGMAANWNLAINRARGEFIVLLSADDMLCTQFLEQCLSVFQSQNADVVTTNHYKIKGDKVIRRCLTVHGGIHRGFMSTLMLKNPFSINFTVFRREAMEKVKKHGRLFREDIYTCDYDLWMRLALSCSNVFYLAEHLGMYRVHGGNLSWQIGRMQRQSALVLLAWRKQLRGLHQVVFRLTLARFLARAFLLAMRTRKIDSRLCKLLIHRLTELPRPARQAALEAAEPRADQLPWQE